MNYHSLKQPIKIITTLFIFYLLFKYINIDEIKSTLLNIDISYIFGAILLQILSTLSATYRWALIMGILNFTHKIKLYIQIYFIGMFFNQILPSSIGGDAYRILKINQITKRKKESVIGVLVDRIIGVLGLFVISFVTNILNYDIFPQWLFFITLFISFGGIIGFIILYNLYRLTLFKNIFILKYFYELSNQIKYMYKDKRTLISHIFISILVHSFSIFAIYFISLSIEADIDLILFLMVMPTVFLLTFIPISLAGWGIRESAMVGILVLVNAVKSKVLIISILYGIILILISILGAYYWLIQTKKERNNEY